MKQLTDLPVYDIWPLIFSKLSIKDLFNCRLVNRQFKYFSDHSNGINKFIIGQPDSRNEDHYWFYNNKLIDDKDIISLEFFRSIKLLSLFNLDKYLKYLKIYDPQFKLKELSNLIKLESIEFGCLNYENQHVINLKNLKILASIGLSVQLNTPKLEKIQSYDLNRIKLNSNPELIKHLITRNYDNKLEIFNNLEIIELRYTTQSINENLLIIFKNLKQLKINLLLGEVYYLNEGINNSLIKILNDKMKLRKEIDVYLEGVKIENMDKFNELKTNENSIWIFRLNNYDLLDLNLSFIQYLNYGQLEKCVNNIENDLPSTFFDKFQYINYVYVYGHVNDVDGLNWFLNNIQYLITLEIGYSTSLGQVFYDNLPSTIKNLYINDNEEDIDYDFILKLFKLIKFDTRVNRDRFDLAFSSFSNLKYLKSFKFNFKRNKIKIERDGEDFYLNYCLRKKKLDYNQLIVECNKIRSK